MSGRDTAAVERDVVQVRGRIDYPSRFNYIHSLEALDRLAHDAAEARRLREQLEQAERMGNEWGAESLYHLERAQTAEAEVARLREQLDAARQALDLVDAPYPLDVFPERTPEQRDAIFAAMRAVDPHATEWLYAHVARDRGRVARAALGVEGEQ